MRLLAGMLGVVLLTGCYEKEAVYAPVPPPPPAPVYQGQVPPLVQLAERNGYRRGMTMGTAMLITGRGISRGTTGRMKRRRGMTIGWTDTALCGCVSECVSAGVRPGVLSAVEGCRYNSA